jgi:hypothetical protein
VNSEEQIQAVSELEDRVERLRALYEQYFMGIEKIEPLIPRKDIDRRLWVLRREQIRNTGLRFKLQQVVSRYNTFGMYWQRILREIENGTYKRDVAKAAKRFGSEALTIAAKRRLGKKGLAELEEAEKKEKAKRERPVAQPVEDEGDSTSPFRRSDLPLQPATQSVEQTIPDAAPPPAQPLPRVASKPKPAPVRLDLDFDDDDELFAGLDTRAPSREPSATRPLPAPVGSAPPPRPASAPLPRPPSTSALPAPPRPLSSPAAAPPRPQSTPGTAAPPPPRPSAPQPQQPSAAPVRSGLAASAPIRSGLASSGNPFAAPAARPAPATPSPPVRPAAAAPPARDESGISEARVKDLYTKYVEAKKQCNESTSTITTDSLAKSLRESASKLRQKHAGKNVDFDDVIKDGKAVLKPVLKGLPRAEADLASAIERLARGGRRLVVAEHDRAVRPVRFANAIAQLGQVFVRVHDLALGGVRCVAVVATAIESHPASAQVFRLADLDPRHALAHTAESFLIPRGTNERTSGGSRKRRETGRHRRGSKRWGPETPA